jgi:hypothetical protein
MIGAVSTVLVAGGIAGLIATGIAVALALLGAGRVTTALDALALFLSLWLPVSALVLTAGLAVDPRRFRRPIHVASVVIGLGTVVWWGSIRLHVAPGFEAVLPDPETTSSLVPLLALASAIQVWRVVSRGCAP